MTCSCWVLALFYQEPNDQISGYKFISKNNVSKNKFNQKNEK